ncbi:hypothetical protein ACET3Z_008344 [Daucus carota]
MIRQRRHQRALRLSLPAPLPSCEFLHHNNLSSSSSSPLSSTSSTNSFTVDNVLDLEKVAVLGHGHGGTVYKVRHKHSANVYALKVLRFDEGEMKIQQEAAVREAEILKRVDSSFIVKCYGVFDNEVLDTDNGGDLCFVMEYMESGSLLDILNICHTLPEKVISVVGRRVLEGLHYLHGMQIVHRDIKPSNLLINSKGEIKIADFGVSIVAKTDEEREWCVGTCAYMSPERFDSERWNGGDCDGFAGDIWSVGVVLLECFVGRYPLIDPGQKLDWTTLMCNICFAEKMVLPDKASPEFRNFVWRCLEKDWRARGTVEELLDHPFVTTCCSASVEGLLGNASETSTQKPEPSLAKWPD